MFATAQGERHVALDDEPGYLIRRAHQIAVSVFYDTIGREVTPVQYAAMRSLQAKPGIDQATLAQGIALDTSTAADIAARLEAKGWITREVRSRGQRCLTLTAEGTAMLMVLVERADALREALLDRLSAAEQDDFMRLLAKFVDVNNEKSRAPLRRAG